MNWRKRWASQPVWARWALVVYLVGFADGTGAHVRDLARAGLHAYAFAPIAAQVFFVGLVLLDPLVIVLVLQMRPAGVWLAGAVMAADMTANWLVNWSATPEYRSRFLAPAGLLPITLFGLFVRSRHLEEDTRSLTGREALKPGRAVLGDETAAGFQLSCDGLPAGRASSIHQVA